VKLAIIREYASAYSTILEAQRREKISRVKWLYIDAYAGPGIHLPKATGVPRERTGHHFFGWADCRLAAGKVATSSTSREATN